MNYFEIIVKDEYWEEKRTLSELEFAKTKEGTLFIDCAYLKPSFFSGKNINFGFFFVKNNFHFIFYNFNHFLNVIEHEILNI